MHVPSKNKDFISLFGQNFTNIVVFDSFLSRDGVNVMGYFIWSLFDNIEWNTGYTVRFGINYIDFKNGLKRHPKQSANWLKKFLKTEKHVEL